MPNLGFQLEVLKQVIRERAAGGDSLATSLSQNNFSNALMQFAVLGAIGPDVLRYMPISSDLASFLAGLVPSATSGMALSPTQISNAQNSAVTALQGLTASTATPAQQALALELYFNPLGAAYSALFSTLVVPVWPILNHITDVLNQLNTIVQNQDTLGAVGMIGEVEGLKDEQSKLAGLAGTVAVLSTIVGVLATEGPWMEMNQTLLPPADPIADRRYEFLRWHHTGRFLQNLLANASTQNQKAFAFGWQCHVAASVAAEPFINNITGGPYRTHWWRNRLVGNYVDAWTFGFFEQNPLPTMAGDNPTPAYCDPQTGEGWPSICAANLQNLFNVAKLSAPATADDVPDAVKAMASGDLSALLSGFPFPAEISNLLQAAMSATYTADLSPLFPGQKLPIVGVDASLNPLPAFASDTFARAYIGAFAVYWFMTSSSGVVGNNPTGVPTGQPEPGWVASGGSPSPTQAGLSVAGTICAAILAIVGLVLILVGDVPLGLAALVAALNAPIIDWSTVANELFWIRKMVVDSENMLRDALVLGALAYPPPVMFGAVDANGNTLPATDLTGGLSLPTTNVPTTQGTPLFKTNNLTSGEEFTAARPISPSYPRGLDTSVQGAADIDFDSFPQSVGEQPLTDNIIAAGLYPNAMIQSGATVMNGGIMGAPSTWPTADQFFGDAVANAVQMIAQQASGLLDYNLDGDRGYGWQTWDPQPGSNPSSPPVVAVNEP